MVTINRINVKNEILNFIRNENIISSTLRGVETRTETFNVLNSTPTLTLAEDGVKNIRQVDVDGTIYTAFEQYNILNLNTRDKTQIEFLTSISGNTISVEYDYGIGDKIYADFPQDFITIDSFPRIGFDIVNIETESLSFSDDYYQKSLVFEFRVLSKSEDVEIIAQNLYDALFNNRKDFFYTTFMRPQDISSKALIDSTSNKIFGVSMRFVAPTQYEN